MKSTTRELIVTSAAVVASAVTIITCSSMQTPAHIAADTPPEEQAVASASAPATAEEPAAPAEPPLEAEPAEVDTSPTIVGWQDPGLMGATEEGNAYPRLPRFYSALAQLRASQRAEHVRIAWLGDSHTQADIWTNVVRAELQKRFGNGGPGFVHVGWTTYGYRRDGIGLETEGRWSVQPNTLVSGVRVGDGVYGLGGVRLVPRGRDARASVEVPPWLLAGSSSWDVAYRFVSRDSSFRISLASNEAKTIRSEATTLGHIQHLELTSESTGARLLVTEPQGDVQLLGVVIESRKEPGVVLDTLGLNGARYRSALTWDEATWVSELSRRKPDLVVLVYGTNESSDHKVNKKGHIERARLLMERVRQAAPETDCLLFGPVDRGGAQFEQAVEQINDAQRAAAEELGCAFWNGQAAMGGKGSMNRWAMAQPPLASGDRVHLNARGYTRLGKMLARDMLAAYRVGVDESLVPGEAEGSPARNAASRQGE